MLLMLQNYWQPIISASDSDTDNKTDRETIKSTAARCLPSSFSLFSSAFAVVASQPQVKQKKTQVEIARKRIIRKRYVLILQPHPTPLLNMEGLLGSAHNQRIPGSLEILRTQSRNLHLELHFKIHNFPFAEISSGFSPVFLLYQSICFFSLPTEPKSIDIHLEEGELLKPPALWRREHLCANSVPQNAASVKASTSHQTLATLETSLTFSLNNLFSVWASAWNEALATLVGVDATLNTQKPSFGESGCKLWNLRRHFPLQDIPILRDQQGNPMEMRSRETIRQHRVNLSHTGNKSCLNEEIEGRDFTLLWFKNPWEIYLFSKLHALKVIDPSLLLFKLE